MPYAEKDTRKVQTDLPKMRPPTGQPSFQLFPDDL